MPQITKFTSSNLAAIDPGEPVLVLLHGYGADERDLPGLSEFLPELPWVSPRAPEDSQYGGYAWFQIETPLNPRPEPVEASTNALWDFIDEFVPESSPLIVLGFSQGGLMATQLLRTRPERILGTVILAGFLLQDEQLADARLQAKKPKVFYGRGTDDMVVTREAAAALNVWLQSHAKAQTKNYSALGHSIDQRMMEDVSTFVTNLLPQSE